MTMATNMQRFRVMPFHGFCTLLKDSTGNMRRYFTVEWRWLCNSEMKCDTFNTVNKTDIQNQIVHIYFFKSQQRPHCVLGIHTCSEDPLWMFLWTWRLESLSQNVHEVLHILHLHLKLFKLLLLTQKFRPESRTMTDMSANKSEKKTIKTTALVIVCS